jgi:hypothetical protein
MRALSTVQWSRALMLAGTVVLVSAGLRAELWVWLFAAAGAMGTGTVISEAALRAAIPASGVGSIQQAGGLERIASVTRLVALPLLGAVLAVIGVQGALLALLGLSMIAALLAHRVPAGHTHHDTTLGRSRPLAGMQQLWRMPAIRSLALQAMVGNFGYTLVMSSLIFYLRTVLHMQSEAVSLTYAAMAVGSFLGTYAVIPLMRRLRRGTMYPFFLTIGMFGLLILQIHWTWSPAIGEGIVALCDTAWVVMSTGLRLELIPSRDRAQVLTASRLLSNSVVPLAGLLAATAGPLVGIPLLFLGAAATKGTEVLVALFSEIRNVDAGRCCAVGAA